MQVIIEIKVGPETIMRLAADDFPHSEQGQAAINAAVERGIQEARLARVRIGNAGKTPRP